MTRTSSGDSRLEPPERDTLARICGRLDSSSDDAWRAAAVAAA